MLCACLGRQNPHIHAGAVNYSVTPQRAGVGWDVDVKQQDVVCLKGCCNVLNYVLLL